jgi:MFS family permease
MIVRRFQERIERGRPVVDYRGAALLSAGLALVVLGALEGGQSWAWDSPVSIVILAGGVTALTVFVLVERKAPEPVLPLWIFRRRLLVTSGLISVGVGGILYGLTSYVPTYAQEVLGAGPLVAGFTLATLTLGWPIAASQSGKVYIRLGFRGCTLVGTTLVLAGCALLLLLGRDSTVWQVGAYGLVIGLGMGLTASPTLIAAQSSVGWAERGVVTANNIFLRSLGSAVGVAVFGALANAAIGDGPVDPARLTVAVQRIFLGLVLVAVVLVVLAALMPKSADRALQSS